MDTLNCRSIDIAGGVSVITPMYNAAKYIKATVDSVRAQSYQNWEMIIVDDCSSDACSAMVQQYAKEDARIRYVRNPHNMGVAESRNQGIALARGRYIAFLDSDDIWNQEKLKKQLAFMEESHASFVYSSCFVIDESGNKSGKTRIVPKEVTYEGLLHGNVIPCLTVLVDKEKTGSFTMPKIPHEDYATWLALLKRVGKAYGIEEPLASYRVSGGSLSGNKLKVMGWQWKVLGMQENIGFFKRVSCMVSYVLQAVKKRV